MQSGIITIYKNAGETPLECLHRLRQDSPQYKDAVLSYAGRLDPLAEGIMLVLVGEENKKREQYLHLDKEYTVQILFGIATDTHDVLGLITEENADTNEKIKDTVENILSSYVKTFEQPYPLFSSKTVNGIPLFQLAKDKVENVVIPTKQVTISQISSLGWKAISMEELYTHIQSIIGKVTGDFRQDEILKMWKTHAAAHQSVSYLVIELAISCTSGTYMRSFAHQLGKDIGVPALALKIIRTKVGKYSINDSPN